jgi:hypothetical protein
MWNRVLPTCLLAGLFVCSPVNLPAAPPAISITVLTTFDYPGVGNSTTPHSINSLGDCTGTYVDPGGVTRGFVRLANGTFSPPLVDPNDTGHLTFPLGINTSRLVCGYYLNSTFHGFFLSGRTYSTFDLPAEISTFIVNVNDAGHFVGVADNGITPQGFINVAGTTTLFSVPGSIITQANSLNATDQIVGTYDDGVTFHGYFRAANGSLTFPLDPPGSTFTNLLAINDGGVVVGRYTGTDGHDHGALFKRPNSFVSFDFPGATDTALNGINNSRIISGRYTDSGGVSHGFLAQVH